MYHKDEIKYKIDEAIQLAMYHADEENWNALLDAQNRLYEKFGIDV